jgi:hypothetical protein
MNEPYLIQRMTKPTRKNGKVFDNPFNFGGGYVNGGFTEKAWAIIKEIVAFDYMGAAEFEFGSLPKSFGEIVKNHATYGAGEITINKIPVYYICSAEMQETVRDWIKGLAKDKFHLKCSSGFKRAVGYLDKWDNDYLEKEKKKDKNFVPYWEKTIGWIDIRNHYMFFTDKETYDKLVELFRIGIPDEKISWIKRLLKKLHVTH